VDSAALVSAGAAALNAQVASAAVNAHIPGKDLESDFKVHAAKSNGRKRINACYDRKDLRNGQLRCLASEGGFGVSVSARLSFFAWIDHLKRMFPLANR